MCISFSAYANTFPIYAIQFPDYANWFPTYANHFPTHETGYHVTEIEFLLKLKFHVTEIEFPFDGITFPKNETNLKKWIEKSQMNANEFQEIKLNLITFYIIIYSGICLCSIMYHNTLRRLQTFKNLDLFSGVS